MNHFLQLGFQCISLAAEDSLPRALALFLPGMIIVITDRSLAGLPGCDLANPESLAAASPTDFSKANLEMPVFLRRPINQGVGQTMGHQKAAGLWGEIDYRADKLAHPDRQLYTSQAHDSELQAWQQKNCRKSEGGQPPSTERVDVLSAVARPDVSGHMLLDHRRGPAHAQPPREVAHAPFPAPSRQQSASARSKWKRGILLHADSVTEPVRALSAIRTLEQRVPIGLFQEL